MSAFKRYSSLLTGKKSKKSAAVKDHTLFCDHIASIDDLIKSDILSSYKKLLQKWLDNMYSCTRNASSKINMDCR